MNFNTVNFEKIIEGQTELFVPKTSHKKGPASKSHVFFNPAMKGNRDVSVLFARATAKEKWEMLDGLGATGVRGLRLYEEVDVPIKIHINERAEKSFQFIEKNIKQWKRADRITATRKDLNRLLYEKRYDLVDIDPFGSPLPYIDSAARAVKNNGILSITATDTAPLCGTYSKACIRRYGARPLRTGCKHEIGLRILAGNIIKRAAAYEVAAIPILCYYDAHYFRCYFRMKKGAGHSDNLLENMGYVIKERGGEYRASKWPEKGKMFGGGLGLGQLHEEGLPHLLLEKADNAISKSTLQLMGLLSGEISAPPFHYNADEIASHLKILPPATSRIVQNLVDAGFRASRVHYDTKGFKTDAGWNDIKDLLCQQF